MAWSLYQAQRAEAMFLRMFRDDAARHQRNRCYYCREPMPAATADHVKPRIKGGTTTRENIRAACFACNLAKGALSSTVFHAIISAKELPRGLPPRLMMAWSRTRIWRRELRAETFILMAAGVAR